MEQAKARRYGADPCFSIVAEVPPFRAFESLHRDAPGGLAAGLHYLEGDHQRALEVLQGLTFQLPRVAGSLSISTGSHARHLRAELELGEPKADGRRDDAIYFYEKLVKAWMDADPSQLEGRERVRARLDALRGASGAS